MASEDTQGRQKILFYPEQIEWLEKMYPELLFTPAMSNDEIRHYSGVRSVVLAIKERATKFRVS